MKIKLYILTLIILVAIDVSASGSILTPRQCSLDGKVLDKPLDIITVIFAGRIKLSENAEAYIVNGDEVIAEASGFSVRNESFVSSSLGYLYIYFNDECLPLGNSYELCLSSGSVCSEEDYKNVNEMLKYTFQVPLDLGSCHFNVPSDSKIGSTGVISCDWQQEINVKRNTSWEIYRDGVFVRNYPVVVSSDIGLGSAYLDFGEILNFENGAMFRIVLPAGSVSGVRDDIVNKDESVEFLGTYSGKLNKPDIVGCSFSQEYFNAVEIEFNSPVDVICEKEILLKKNATSDDLCYLPTSCFIDEEGIKMTVFCRYSDINLNDCYSLVIPDGVVVTRSGDILVNEYKELQLDKSTLSAIQITSSKICSGKRCIEISDNYSSSTVRVYDLFGKVIYKEENIGNSCCIPVSCPGVYIVIIGGKIKKIIVW